MNFWSEGCQTGTSRPLGSGNLSEIIHRGNLWDGNMKEMTWKKGLCHISKLYDDKRDSFMCKQEAMTERSPATYSTIYKSAKGVKVDFLLDCPCFPPDP